MCAPALVLVDFQRAFVEPGFHTSLTDAPAAWLRAESLLAAFEDARLPTVVTRPAPPAPPRGRAMARWWKTFLLESSPESELCDPRLASADLCLTKEHYSAFLHTGLSSWLRERGVETVVIAGVMTHICVDSTARDAFQLGFDVVVVSDACASKHRELHNASLLTLSHAVARVASSPDVTAALAAGGRC